MERAEALREFQGLVERVGGRQQLLLVGEAREGAPPPPPRALLETFARDLFAEPGKQQQQQQQEPEKAPAQAQPPVARRVRVRGGGGGSGDGRPWLACPLLFVLFRAGSLLQPRWCRERLRLREILRDLRSQLPGRRRAASALAPTAVVGVVVAEAAAAHACSSGARERDRAQPGDAAEEARLQLEALLRQVFRERRGRRPGHQDTLQAATYRPGGAQGAAEVRAAACRALRAALKLRADGVETRKRGLPAFLQCLSWGRRRLRRKGHLDSAGKQLSEDALHDPNEAVALTNVTPNGNCEDGSRGAGP